MTSPEPAPDQQGLTGGEQEAVAALAAALAEGAIIGAIALPPYLYSKLLHLGFRRDAIDAVAGFALQGPLLASRPHGTRARGTAASRIAADEPMLRAQYIVNAIKRVTTDLRTLIPAAPGRTPLTRRERLAGAVRRERRYWDQHHAAQRNRRRAAHDVDKVARNWEFLQWRTAGDSRVEADCRRLDMKVFTIDQPLTLHGRPVFPGMVHPHCRCYAMPASSPDLFGSQATVSATR